MNSKVFLSITSTSCWTSKSAFRKMLCLLLSSLLLVLVSSPQVTEGSVNSVDSLDEQILLKWTSSALKFFDFHRCVQLNIAGESECYKLSQVPRSQIAVYVGRAKVDMDNEKSYSDSTFLYQVVGKGNGGVGRKKVHAILPDSVSQKESKAHDVVLALDPYPTANFGHLVGLFYINFGVEDRYCQEDHQSLTADQTCITVARKSRCPNLLERHTSGYLPKRCHIDFLPTVHLAGLNYGTILGPSGDDMTPIDLLECIRTPGFANCPKLRSYQETDKVLCDAANVNSKRCDTSYNGVGTRCKLFQTCDRAVLVGGGWNRHHSGTQSLLNIFKLDEMLQRNGFQGDNIKTFYANGGQPVSSSSDNGNGDSNGRQMLSSAMKTGLRGHLRTICESRHCADTFFIYLNNPTTVDGDMLLWDVDYNGIANELEVYPVKEFLSDISRCEAKRVILLVDQSNTDILLNLIKISGDHQNVILFAATGQVSTNGELTDIWANHSHPTSCLQHLQDTSNKKMRDLTAVVHGNSVGTLPPISIIGAPCDLNPPLTTRELRSLYQGCQNVPTSVWFSLNYGGSSSEDTDDDDDDLDDGGGDENSSNNRRIS